LFSILPNSMYFFNSIVTYIFRWTAVSKRIVAMSMSDLIKRFWQAIVFVWEMVWLLEFPNRITQFIHAWPWLSFDIFNTSYLTDSYFVFTFKMESVPKIKIFSLKIMV
jgi:hypothetical protein